MSKLEVPTLDLRRFHSDRDAFVHDVGEAYKKYGFCCFSHHGIAEKHLETAYKDFRNFFNLPEKIKLKYYQEGTGGARGYTPFKTETAKDLKIADLKEFYHFGREMSEDERQALQLEGKVFQENLWPEEVHGFKEDSIVLYEKMETVAKSILSAMALNIGLTEDYFEDVIRNGDTIIRALHYPPIKPEDLPAVRAGAHEDIDLITLLVGATDSGLELLTKDGDGKEFWLPINAAPNTLVVNVGDMLQRLTNNVYKSTTHRVVNPEGDAALRPRYSIPFFVHPRADFLIKTLPQCYSSDRDNLYPEPIAAKDYLDQRLREIKLKK